VEEVFYFKKRLRRNGHLLIILSLGLICLVTYFLIHFYYQSVSQSKREVLNRLRAITSTAALQIDGDLHLQLSEGYMERDAIRSNEENPLYKRLHHILKSVKTANALATDIYTIVYYAPDSTFHFIGTSSDYPYFRHPYKNYPKALLINYDKGGALDVYEDENGIWLSAFSPIRSSKGAIVGLVQADERFESFMSRSNKDLMQNLLISVLIVLPFSLFLFGYIFSSLTKQAETQDLLIRQSEEIKSQNEEIRSQNEFIEKQNRDLDKKVDEKNIALIRSNHQLASFLYHSSHDVQAPLATLKGIVHLAEMDLVDKDFARYILMIKDTTDKLDKMIKTLQLVYEIKSRELMIEKINLKNMILGIVKSNALGYKGQTDVRVENGVEVESDYGFLSVIIDELVKNAFQYGVQNEQSIVKVSAVHGVNGIDLIVEDNGKGVPVSDQESLFSLFSRRHENSTGMGLGLFIAQTCTERLGAHISVSSSSMGGASFLVRLSV
jgi:signal transduction histidine kinase